MKVKHVSLTHLCQPYTPLKTNMEPENHPIEKENHLPNLLFGSMFIFRGVDGMGLYLVAVILRFELPDFD